MPLQGVSVRSYSDRPLEEQVLTALQDAVAKANAESGLHIQLVANEPKVFDSFMAHYGKFSGVQNYFALVGKKGAGLDGEPLSSPKSIWAL